MAQMTSEVSKLLEQALSLSVEEQEALADSLISVLDSVQGVHGEEQSDTLPEAISGSLDESFDRSRRYSPEFDYLNLELCNRKLRTRNTRRISVNR